MKEKLIKKLFIYYAMINVPAHGGNPDPDHPRNMQ